MWSEIAWTCWSEFQLYLAGRNNKIKNMVKIIFAVNVVNPIAIGKRDLTRYSEQIDIVPGMHNPYRASKVGNWGSSSDFYCNLNVVCS